MEYLCVLCLRVIYIFCTYLKNYKSLYPSKDLEFRSHTMIQIAHAACLSSPLVYRDYRVVGIFLGACLVNTSLALRLVQFYTVFEFAHWNISTPQLQISIFHYTRLIIAIKCACVIRVTCLENCEKITTYRLHVFHKAHIGGATVCTPQEHVFILCCC